MANETTNNDIIKREQEWQFWEKSLKMMFGEAFNTPTVMTDKQYELTNILTNATMENTNKNNIVNKDTKKRYGKEIKY